MHTIPDEVHNSTAGNLANFGPLCLVVAQLEVQRAKWGLHRKLLLGLVEEAQQREHRHIQRWPLQLPLEVVLLPDIEAKAKAEEAPATTTCTSSQGSGNRE